MSGILTPVPPPGLDGPAIRVEGLRKTFGDRPALDGVDLTVAKGEVVALLGPNGAGKTTLIMVLATLMRSFSGRAAVGDLDLRRQPREVRERIGVVSHDTFLYRDLTAEENLAFYARLYELGDIRQRVTEGLEQAGLAERRHERVEALSRGMKQRLSIARALLHRPGILLLDEPEAGLDQETLSRIWNTLRFDNAARRTILLATHDLERGRELADRVLIMDRGRMVLDRPSRGLSGGELHSLYEGLTGSGR